MSENISCVHFTTVVLLTREMSHRPDADPTGTRLLIPTHIQQRPSKCRLRQNPQGLLGGREQPLGGEHKISMESPERHPTG